MHYIQHATFYSQDVVRYPVIKFNFPLCYLAIYFLRNSKSKKYRTSTSHDKEKLTFIVLNALVKVL